jgi:predicted HTH domain antitoxin
MAITLELPQEMERQLREEHPDLDRHILEGYAVDAFRRGELGSAQVCEILGMRSRWEAIRFLGEQGVYPGYEAEDLEQDLRNLAELQGNQSQ